MNARNLPELGLMSSYQIDEFCRTIVHEASEALTMLRNAENQLNADNMLTDKVSDWLESCQRSLRSILKSVGQ